MTAEIARRAVAAPHWRWLRGMTSIWSYDDGQPMRWLCRPSADGHVMCGPCADGHPQHNDGALPDLEDPATVGCLLALVREAWGDEYIYCASSLNIHQRRWYRVVMDGDIIGSGCNEGMALVEALEVVP